MSTSLSKKWFSIKAADTLALISHPLKNYGLENFIHDITFEKGQISLLSNNKTLLEDYYKNQIPAVCTNEQGRILVPGIYLDCKLKKEHPDYQLSINRASKKFNIKNFVHIMEVEHECQHLYSFSFKFDEVDFLQFSVNNINLIRKFIANYKLKAYEIISKAKLPKNRITLPLFDNNQHKNTLVFQDTSLQEDKLKQSFLHKNKKELITLTSQQTKCLTLLMRGNSAKKIARHLHISSKTVEHHIANLKEKLGYRYSKDLISSYYMGRL